jgi:hypothetical protein
MSMHKIPLTALEEEGLRNHGLPIGVPSQLSDTFRHGVAWAVKSTDSELAALRAEEAERKLADKDRDRRYHMDAINRLASFLALSGTSFEVIQAAIDNMTRMARELSELRALMKEGGE